MSDVITVQRLVPAPAEPIFDLLADPAGHAEIDGGGTVKGARSGGRRLALGDRFGMDMHLGVAYSTRNTVVELEENRRIAWQTTAGGPLGNVLGGRIWRYELEPVEGGTLVTRDVGPEPGEVDEQAGGQADHDGVDPAQHGAHPRADRRPRDRCSGPRGQLTLLGDARHRPAHGAGADVPGPAGQRGDRPAGRQPQRAPGPARAAAPPHRRRSARSRGGPPTAGVGRAAGTAPRPGPRRSPRARAGTAARAASSSATVVGRSVAPSRPATRADCAT